MSLKSPTKLSSDSDAKIDKLVEMVTGIKNSQNKIVTTLNSCRESIKIQENKFISFESKIELLTTQLSEAIEENKLLKVKVEQLEIKLSEVEHSKYNASSGPSVQENVFSEIMDRQSRVRNIILFNVPEFSNPATDQFNDSSSVKNILDTIGVSVNQISVRRLGKASNKARPLRVTLPDASFVFDILKVKRKLLDVDRFSSIRISSDQTPLQRNYFASILSELKTRKNAGENNLYIKYVNSIPTISKNVQANIRH